ncbi:MAG: methyltransferase domain-containing protein [Bryobacterales bacterium]|nr:methyltransferase domain-containing protein [Bryobacterales bacterium]
MAAEQSKHVEIEAVIREVQDRVRARYPLHAAGQAQIPLADLMPAVHARDRAEAKAGAIGTVNPRPPGLLNNVIQSFKRAIARSLHWLLREQVEFNRASLDCVQSLIEAVNESNRAVSTLASQIDRRFEDLRAELRADSGRLAEASSQLAAEARELKDVRRHWAEWRQHWEHKLSVNEIQFLRSVADLQTAFQHRATLMESNFRDVASSQHRDFTVALDQARLDIQERLWGEMEKARLQVEKVIHSELRTLRQRVHTLPSAAAPQPPLHGEQPIRFEDPPFDFLRHSDRFRGSEEYVRSQQQRYLRAFQGCNEVLDTGCGRGEFLESLRDAGMLVKGIDSNAEMVSICRAKGLYAEQADLFHYLGELDEASLDGIFCSQVVEHLPPDRLPEFLSLAAAALRPKGRIVIETPNPECLAIFASHFYLDPTHRRPIPAPLLAFYLEESGFGAIKVEYINNAEDTMPEIEALPEAFRAKFFGGLDYSIQAAKL